MLASDGICIERPSLGKLSEKVIAFFHIDVRHLHMRSCCRVKRPTNSSEDAALEFDAGRHPHSIIEIMLRQLIKISETEIDLSVESGDDHCIWSFLALVDLPCYRIHSFEIMLVEGKDFPVKRIVSLDHVLCPDYVVLHFPKKLTERPTSFCNNVACLTDSPEELLLILPAISNDKRRSDSKCSGPFIVIFRWKEGNDQPVGEFFALAFSYPFNANTQRDSNYA
ncbi:hypothetical protein CVT26_009037 [Gymnopilus dilepis]|uniref:Uncharacterized protein n=1 Tax=Gymnopilus dilepis TaxID=231916 RepID=A0A409WCT8_9AGAR|nr:hypothetical protein CVT26_009037 [Gymnopilus dilepis]